MDNVKKAFRTLILIMCVTVPFGSSGAPAPNPFPAPDIVTTAETPNRFDISRTRLDNHSGIDRLARRIDSLSRSGMLRRVEISGSASPDGPRDLNERLARERASVMAEYLRKQAYIPDTMLIVRSKGENWSLLRSLIENSRLGDKADGMIRIIDETEDPDLRERRLRNFCGRSYWRVLARDVFPAVRVAEVDVTYDDGRLSVVVPTEGDVRITETAIPVADTAVTVDSVPADNAEEDTACGNHITVKTNVPAWAMIWLNAAVEFDIKPHWSVTIPVYYSGFNYFHRNRKFRTFAVQPEARYWFSPCNNGFFIGAHLGLAYYNVAFGGENRYQDHSRRHPAMGGGVSVGYRFSFTRNPRWRLELALGGGVYHLDYDVFDNVPNGLIKERCKRTFFGIDNAAVSVCYQFGYRKGGKR